MLPEKRRAGRRERKWRRYLRAVEAIVGPMEPWQRVTLRRWWEEWA